MALVGRVQLIAGGLDDLDSVINFLEKENISVRGNIDAYVRTYKHFGIDDARELSARASARAVSNSRIFLIAASAFALEAQNALLKTLEEADRSLFVFIVPSPETLLPTLRSRAQILTLPKRAVDSSDTKKFLSASAQARLDMLKQFLERDENDEREVGAIIEFLSSLEKEMSRTASNSDTSREGIRAVYRARRYIADRGALLKPLLEQVALLVPKL